MEALWCSPAWFSLFFLLLLLLSPFLSFCSSLLLVFGCSFWMRSSFLLLLLLPRSRSFVPLSCCLCLYLLLLFPLPLASSTSTLSLFCSSLLTTFVPSLCPFLQVFGLFLVCLSSPVLPFLSPGCLTGVSASFFSPSAFFGAPRLLCSKMLPFPLPVPSRSAACFSVSPPPYSTSPRAFLCASRLSCPVFSCPAPPCCTLLGPSLSFDWRCITIFPAISPPQPWSLYVSLSVFLPYPADYLRVSSS